MRLTARRPQIESEAFAILDKLPKAVLMEIVRDYAIKATGGDEGYAADAMAWVRDVAATHETLKANGMSK